MLSTLLKYFKKKEVLTKIHYEVQSLINNSWKSISPKFKYADSAIIFIKKKTNVMNEGLTRAVKITTEVL